MNTPAVQMITPKDALDAVTAQKAVLVDVREREELEESGLAEPARWIATSEVEDNTPEWKAFVTQLPKDKQIILYCKAGGRSNHVAMKLAQMGFKTANMGGFEGWAKAGFSVKKL